MNPPDPTNPIDMIAMSLAIDLAMLPEPARTEAFLKLLSDIVDQMPDSEIRALRAAVTSEPSLVNEQPTREFLDMIDGKLALRGMNLGAETTTETKGETP